MKRIVVVVVLLLGVLPRVAQSQTCQADLTGETIHFYHFGDLSGVLAQLSLPVLAGFEDAITYFNAQGGLCGATIAMEYRDTGGSQTAAQAAWDDFSARPDATVMFVYLTEDAELLRDQAAAQELPIVVSSGSVRALYGDNAATPGWVFSVTPIYADQLGAFCAYISQHWAEFGIPGEPVVGHISFLGALGESSDTPEARAYCESVGVGYADARYYFPGIPDIAPLIQGVVDAGANILYTTSVATGPVQLAATVQAMGLGGQVMLAGPNIIMDTGTLTLGGESVIGMVGQLPYRWWDESEHPGIQLVAQYWLENRFPRYDNPTDGLAVRNVAYLIAWAAVDGYLKLMTDTINRVGYENISGAAMFETMTSGRAYEALEGVVTIQYSATTREPRQTRIASIQWVETAEGTVAQILPLTEFIAVPDLKPGGADVPR